MKIKPTGLVAFIINECAMLMHLIAKLAIVLAVLTGIGGLTLNGPIPLSWLMLVYIGLTNYVLALLFRYIHLRIT